MSLMSPEILDKNVIKPTIVVDLSRLSFVYDFGIIFTYMNDNKLSILDK